jgi:hypothetical protein
MKSDSRPATGPVHLSEELAADAQTEDGQAISIKKFAGGQEMERSPLGKQSDPSKTAEFNIWTEMLTAETGS